jgi:hypothetical protein
MDDEFEQADPVRLDRTVTMSNRESTLKGKVAKPATIAAALTELWSPRVVGSIADPLRCL